MAGSSVVCRFEGITIKIYPLNHRPPHFHVEYNEFEAIIVINELTLYEGDLPRKILNKVLNWAEQHKDELIANWRLIEKCSYPRPIDPP
jgi:hypothetical protein